MLLCRVIEELENHIQVLPVYLFALTLVNARLACLFATTLPLDVILDCTVRQFSFYFLYPLVLLGFISFCFLLLTTTFFAVARCCPTGNLLSLNRLLVMVTIVVLILLSVQCCDGRYRIDAQEATWLGRDASKRVELHHLVFDIIYFNGRLGIIARERRQVVVHVHLFVILQR